ncbi:baseplate hub subunit [Synechococcus phage ACG-2014f]|uniref:Baseplate hub subunit n=5 Tax=Atlauavirus TaxID=2733092 RepID=A0A0E3FRZ1_9CAUD|nr:baseplate hub [Synechococcus phage ACG-2014f]YP_009778162.1 baseplate hub [Synechococcus phage ACG-2014f_Syn7803C7]YP_009778449.1 baseplate hub [Synechococcus phage ACG-2014f_Syn7803C8]YP_009778735.1 baseplate hub [Synechococcus phage ACG-2014f_Syn7803US26]AIX16533.1 baseplate hub subunit [Synechococcus phage ACG-2014f]AIX18307.1 baseplate hub subunit [Synechococcus phage ACG-2014f]AIX19899.1 baseplate hub subunit [Synechococcus phage ACG-2014f_Syn7803C7]AIX20185.1 baseplate hub subunit [
MALPKIAKITYELVIPSTGKKIKYRPFLVKEEKVLILAQESGSQTEMTRAIKDVISACVQTRGFKVDQMATFDIEYVFLNIRGRSVGESVDVIVTCPDDEKTTVPVTIYLDEIEVIFDENHEANIKLDDTYSVQMKYPTMEQVMEADADNISIQESLELIAKCIDQIYSEEESFAASDSSLKELVSWVEDLEPKQFTKLENFFTTMPKLSHTINVMNPETDVESSVVLEGLGSFFA